MSPAVLHDQLLGYVLFDFLLLLVAGGLWVMLARVVFRRLDVLPDTLVQPAWTKVIQGLVAGLVILVLAIIPVWVGGGYSSGGGWEPFDYSGSLAGSLGLLWGFFCLQSLFEELLFRVIGLSTLATLLFWLAGFIFAPRDPVARFRFTGRLWFMVGLLANVITAIGFAVVHLGNQHISFIAFFNIALAGLVLGQIYWNHGSPWGAWIVHWLWNAGLATVGLPVSGYAMLTPVEGTGFLGARPGLFSGGAFGPEGSTVTTVALILVWLWLAWQGWRAVLRREAAGMPTDIESTTSPEQPELQ